MILPAGNYEYPFEYTLPGSTPESVEGIPEASITYRLKATVGRGKLAYDLHAYKHLRVIRTLDPAALELHHAMSVENIWPQKVDYSIVIPHKAVVFGGHVPLNIRLTPLLKGLEVGLVTAKFVELRECCIQGPTGLTLRDHKTEREVKTWKFNTTRDSFHDMIEGTGQEGWVIEKDLDLPRRLRQCIQDVNLHGIKVRHKIKLTVALHNPDGHISELRATLPISIFISPNVPLNEQGDMVEQNNGQQSVSADLDSTAPPGYGDHQLDQLYEEIDMAGFRTPAVQSGFSSPFYHSRAGSMENLAAFAQNSPITPAALSSRLANVSDDPTMRNTAFNAGIGATSEPASASLTRSNSGEDSPSGRHSPERIDITEEEFAELNRVPSYTTALRTPARSRATSAAVQLPDYQTALSAPATPPAVENHTVGLPPIVEGSVSQGPQRPVSFASHRTASEGVTP